MEFQHKQRQMPKNVTFERLTFHLFLILKASTQFCAKKKEQENSHKRKYFMKYVSWSIFLFLI